MSHGTLNKLHLLVALAVALAASRGVAQSNFAPSSDLSDVVQVDEASSAARALLERAKAHAIEKQWDDAIETFRQVMEHDGGKPINLDPRHFITVREFCQMRLAEMPPEGRTLYRSRVDPLAKQWYDRGVASRDAKLLGRVVDQLFVSSWGDSALLALGEIELEQGDYQQARWCWERISPELRGADGQPLWLSLRMSRPADAKPPRETAQRPPAKNHDPPRWLAYPDTKLNMADVRARLALVSIMEGAWDRAKVELADFRRRHPDAKGHLAGREGLYAETLDKLLAAAKTSPQAPPLHDWTTFAGSYERTAIAEMPKSVGNKLWEIPLGDETPLKASIEAAHYVAIDKLHWPLPPIRPAEDQQALLSVFPLVVSNLVLFSTTDKVFAFDLATGKPAWPVANGPPMPDGSAAQPREVGEIYSGAKYRDDAINPSPGGASFQAFGAPRFTLTADGNRLYARLGSPITERLEGRPSTGSNYLICLDLSAQGLLLWRTPGENGQDERWAFEGAPVVRGNNVYVVMRYSDVRPQVHVACLDARSGGLRWRKLVCTNETVVGGQWPEITSNLLTLAGETLYLNTNLGAVAALSAADGEIRWISDYPRARTSDPRKNAAHFYRDLTPAVYYRGSLFVAPSDSPSIFAIDATTGALLWETSFSGIEQNMHLLGVGGDNLIASGWQLWWINVDSGRTINNWNDNTACGYGRGALVGDEVYWSMRGAAGMQIRRLKQRVPESFVRDISFFDADDPILLERFDPPLSGGNLVAANGYLLIATPTKLIAFGPGKPMAPNERILTQNANRAGAAERRE
jgi:outer membrane protein assembly factor BamB